MKLGLVSATFRQLTAEQIIDIAAKNAMQAIEWSADKHVVAGDLDKACKVKELCDKNNLDIVTYGSYFKVGESLEPEKEFGAVVATAKQLGVHNIRVWAGSVASSKADDVCLKKFLEQARIAADMAAQQGMQISFEYHLNTLMDNYISVIGLFGTFKRDNIYLNWQPNQTSSLIYNVYELKMLLPYISNVHVFYRSPSNECEQLIEGKDDWAQYIKVLAGKERAFLLEFVKDNSVQVMETDYALLKEIAGVRQ